MEYDQGEAMETDRPRIKSTVHTAQGRNIKVRHHNEMKVFFVYIEYRCREQGNCISGELVAGPRPEPRQRSHGR
jgi:uncharacterized protein YbaA (DUF1428 family)